MVAMMVIEHQKSRWGYGKTITTALELWKNIGNHVKVVANMGTTTKGEWKDGGMVGVGLTDGNNTGDGGGGVGATMKMRMRR